MIESIDNLLGVLRTQRGKELRFEVGQRAQLVTAAGAFDLSPNPMTPADIRSWIGPIVPPDARQVLATNPEAEFKYHCAGIGDFKVKAIRSGGGLSFIFSPVLSTQPLTSPSVQPPSVAPANTPPQKSAGGSPEPPQVQPAAQVAAPPAPASYGPPQAVPAPSAPAASSGNLGAVVSAPAGSLTMDDLFRRMCDAGASDLHMSVSKPPMIRKDGEMRVLDPEMGPLNPEESRRLMTSIMPEKNREEFERRHDTDFAYEIRDLARFRANVFMDRKGIGGVFRVIPNKILTAEDLSLSPHILKLCHLNKGLVVVTGPTGSGKSTTLCALIDYVNRNRSDHIITIEDPIEFVHENKKCLINQREVHNHTDSFRDALRAALREDPDIILVGEMRDLETVAIAIETAETGHLVFGTLHTTTAASTVDRIIDQFPPDRQTQIRVMLSESLRGVISQTLLKKNGGGRVAALEVLMVNAAVSNLIREGKTFQIPSVMQTGRGAGNVTLNDALIELVKNKVVPAEEAYNKAVDKSGFESLLKRNNVDTRFVSGAAA